MNLEKYNDILIRFIEKYPFFVDPITLFRTDSIINEDDFLSGIINYNYPEINKNLKIINKIEKELEQIKYELNKVIFDNKNYKDEYFNRINDFYKVLKIIKIFYDDDEEEKFNLINNYFGIDLIKIGKILKNKDNLLKKFSSNNILLSSEKIEKLKNTILNADEIKFYFEKALKYLNLENAWKVKIGNSTSIVHTNFNKLGGEIIIPKNRKVNIKKLLELIIHEIDGHCMQFSNSKGLFSGSIRFSKSEEILEGYAIYLECLLTAKYFGENRIEELIYKRELFYKYYINEINLKKILECKKIISFRLFRGFKYIKTFINLKDLIYLQGIYSIIENMKIYSNFLDMINKGVINQNYIDLYGTKDGINNIFNLNKTSTIFILEKYFK